uniref:7TM_GPCR_Srx domain-containing protein n=1 Tax=Heterorhabditis bacteriophora TaxID=37862 RepID=A0A1I7X8C0_HETBA
MAGMSIIIGLQVVCYMGGSLGIITNLLLLRSIRSTAKEWKSIWFFQYIAAIIDIFYSIIITGVHPNI